MLKWLTNNYRQVAFLESNSVPLQEPKTTQSSTEFTDTFLDTQIFIVPASIADIRRSELSQDYLELGETLNNMFDLDENDEWRIDEPVYATACHIAAELMVTTPYPAPRIFNHGPESVVFNWSRETTNLYLTISSNKISALLSSQERIEQRIDQTIDQLFNPARFLSFVTPSHLEHSLASIKAGSDDPSELFD
jgi:hypothetical protein